MNIVEEIRQQEPSRKVKKIIRDNSEYTDRLKTETYFLGGTEYDNFENRYIALLFGLTEDNYRCPYCGNIRKILSKKVLKTCGGNDCEHKMYSEHMFTRHKNETIEEKEAIRQAMKKTCMERYGVEYSTQSSIMKIASEKTKIVRYGNKNYNNRNKARETNIERYGCELPLQNREILEKTKNTNKEKYGVENVFQSKNVKETIKKTNREKYGVDYPMQSAEIRQKIDYAQSAEKQYITKIKNKTLHSSSHEIKIYEYLKEKYGDVKTQYRDKRYSSKNGTMFRCDYYIPQYDLFIEYQGTYYHGKEPYDKEKHKDLYEEYKKKSDARPQNRGKNNYLNLLYIWTEKDVEKRNVAKENNLNFIEIWNKQGQMPSKEEIIGKIDLYIENIKK